MKRVSSSLTFTKCTVDETIITTVTMFDVLILYTWDTPFIFKPNPFSAQIRIWVLDPNPNKKQLVQKESQSK